MNNVESFYVETKSICCDYDFRKEVSSKRRFGVCYCKISPCLEVKTISQEDFGVMSIKFGWFFNKQKTGLVFDANQNHISNI